jgi:hypothetical protein
MVYHVVSLISHPLFALSKAERRGQLVGMLLVSIVIMITGFVLVLRNRKKK